MKKWLYSWWLKIKAFKNLIYNENSFLYETGWINSSGEAKPVDKYNSYVPWMNYQFIDFITERLTNEMDLYEYGSGYSTVYWCHRVNSVTCVEHIKEWFNFIDSKKPDNCHLIFSDDLENMGYAKSCLTTNIEYDVIIVDGRNRVECIEYALLSLKNNGVIILDDSQRARYE